MKDYEQPSTGTLTNPLSFNDAVNHALKLLSMWHQEDKDIFKYSEIQHDLEIIKIISRLAYHNYQIWHHEDRARMSDVVVIATAKNNIDPHNQQRNNEIESIDEYYIAYQANCGVYNSETLGSILDRIIITELKILHMCDLNLEMKAATLTKQQSLLINCGALLLSEILRGDRQIYNFKQHKMYNNPTTNPLFGK